MRRGRRKIENPATARRILAAAEQHFAAQGLAGARTEQIATAAHANKAMLYYYFGDKRHLHRAVLENLFRQLRSGVYQPQRKQASPGERLREFITAISTFSHRIRIIRGWYTAKRWKPRKNSTGSCVSICGLFIINWCALSKKE